MVTSRDVARLAGVSQSTVSYVMSGRRAISAETRHRVESAIAELAFQPNAGARALKSQRTRVIGLVVPFGAGADTSGLLPFIETIATCAREQDHDILLVTRDEGSAGLTRLASRSLCDAIVLMDIDAHDARIPVAAALPVPVILIGLPDDPRGLPCVDLDFERAGGLAVDHLAATGHDRIVLLGHPREAVRRELNFIGRFRRGVTGAAAAHGLPCTIVDQPERGPAGIAAALAEALPFGTDKPAGEERGARERRQAGEQHEARERRQAGAQRGARERRQAGEQHGAREQRRAGEEREGGRHPSAGGRVGLVVQDTEAVQPVVQALSVLGRVPGKGLSVVGLCPDALAESTDPPVTNVSLEPREVSRRAMRTLFGLLDRDRAAEVAPVELIAPRLTPRRTG